MLIYFSGEWVVDGVLKIARYLGWREFVLSFLVMAFAGSLPNLFIGISSALKGIPQLSLGEIVSGNLVDLTLILALPILITGRVIHTDGKLINFTLFFTAASTIFPLLLIADGLLSRADGIVLILFYFVYMIWLFSKKERFTRQYDEEEVEKEALGEAFSSFIKGIGKGLLGIALLVIASQGIVWSAELIAEDLAIPIILVGIFIVGLGNSLPELYFTLKSSEKENNYMILGNIMGAVITPATLILGIVAVICPIEVNGLDNFTVARAFLLIACLLFFLFGRTGRKITRGEALILASIYVFFIISQIIISF